MGTSRFSLSQPLDLNRRFDLVWCFEVAEHIHPDYVETFLDSLVRHSDTVAMSAAPPGQGGEGHFNEQPWSYWIAKLDTREYRLHEEWTDELRAVKEFYSDNMMVFTRRRTFPDGQSALSLAAARLRHIAGTAWSTKRYLNIELLKDQMTGAITA
jgi:hypothetical protein